MLLDLITKLKTNENARFVLEKLVNFNEKDKIHVKNKNGIYNIEIIKDDKNYIIITLKGTLDNFTDISTKEMIDGYYIFNSLFYINEDKYFVDEINEYTEITLNNKIIYIRKGTSEYFKDYKNDIMRRSGGKYTFWKYENGNYRKFPTNEISFDDFIHYDDEIYTYRKK